MPSSWKEESLKHKYAQVPEEAPRHRKKSKRKSPKKSNHKHEYRNCYIRCKDTFHKEHEPSFSWHTVLASYCPICGKVAWPVEDSELRAAFPDAKSFHYFGYYFTRRERYEEYYQWCLDHYPCFTIENYDNLKLGGQVFVPSDQLPQD